MKWRHIAADRKRTLQALGLVCLLLVFPFSWPGQENSLETDSQIPGESVSENSEETGGEAPRIALTFDDGPDSVCTPALLDGLKARGVHATFFVIGANIEKDGNAEIIRRMYEEGHLIGNHTYHHVNLSELDSDQAKNEIELTDDLVREITGEAPYLVRPPFGAFPKGEEASDKLYVKWTVDSRDWVTKNTGEIVSKVVTDAGEGDIILMHDCYETSVEAALEIIDIFQGKGYDFVTLDELLVD